MILLRRRFLQIGDRYMLEVALPGVEDERVTETRAASDSVANERLRRLRDVSLIDTLVHRRSRRFALGSELDGGALSYRSRHEAVPLSAEEEAVLVFAACGVTGFSLGELPYDRGKNPASGGGNIMVTPFARTISSADGVNSASLFLLNDDGGFQIRRPQAYPRDDLQGLADAARRGEFLDLYDRARIRLADRRPEILRQSPYVPPFNIWSTNIPGSTYFVLVSELTMLALTIIFLVLSEDMGFFLFDERNGYRPAGLKRFAKSKGGHLHNDPNDLRIGTILEFESYILELAAVEQGLMLQNLELATEALGLGGFPHYGAQKWQWFEALGFRMHDYSLVDLVRRGRIPTALMKVARKNPVIPHPIGLEVDGEVTIKPFCPPYYESMEEAVHAFVDSKYAKGRGVFADGSDASAWKDVPAVQAQVEKYSQANIDAVVAYCEYVHKTFGRFLGHFGPLRSLMAYQAHHVDTEFYDRFYKPGAYHDAHVDHFAQWHEGPT
jgi:hypothetical protein